jgi:hypothetical protein
MGCCQSSIDLNKELKFKTQDQLTAKHATTYLVSCMDFRLLDDIVRAMDNMGYNNNYDQFIVAGASLGFCQNKYPHWRQTVMDHLEIGLNLHKFREFIFIDHLDCGAYKKFFPEIKTLDDEKKCHKEQLQQAYDILIDKFPEFKFQAFLMDLYGNLEEIPIEKNQNHLVIIETKGDNFLSTMDDNLLEKKYGHESLFRSISRKFSELQTTGFNKDEY